MFARRCPTSRNRRVRSRSRRSTGRWPRGWPCARRATTRPPPRALQDLYAANPENKQVEQALLDPSFGIVTTTAARIEARTDPWDPRHRAHADDFVDPGAHERKAVLLAEAERQLGEFIGLDEVKNQVPRLKSSVAMELVRKQRGLAVAQRTHHLVFAGPPGTGKTTIARVVAKIYCGLGLLKKENIKEVHRADLIGQHIGETEAKTNAIIDSALDGVLFLDEAYALVATGAKNDFGLVAIDTLLARMENDRDRLVVIIAGYRADLDRFLDTNEGLRSRFTRSIDFPSYTAGGAGRDRQRHGPPARQRLRAGRARRPGAAVRPLGRRHDARRQRGGPAQPRYRRQRPVRAKRRRTLRRGARIPPRPPGQAGSAVHRLHRRGADDDHGRRCPQLGGAAAARPRTDGAAMSNERRGPSRRPAFVHLAHPGQRESRSGDYRRGFVTRHQVTGWRFVMRRIASGVALHDTRMLVDPLRTQSRSVLMGALILITGLLGCFVFSLIRPNGAAG